MPEYAFEMMSALSAHTAMLGQRGTIEEGKADLTVSE